jgi:hypothetical protein
VQPVKRRAKRERGESQSSPSSRSVRVWDAALFLGVCASQVSIGSVDLPSGFFMRAYLLHFNCGDFASFAAF